MAGQGYKVTTICEYVLLFVVGLLLMHAPLLYLFYFCPALFAVESTRYTTGGQLGDLIGGWGGTFLTLISMLLIYRAYRLQREELHRLLFEERYKSLKEVWGAASKVQFAVEQLRTKFKSSEQTDNQDPSMGWSRVVHREYGQLYDVRLALEEAVAVARFDEPSVADFVKDLRAYLQELDRCFELVYPSQPTMGGGIPDDVVKAKDYIHGGQSKDEFTQKCETLFASLRKATELIDGQEKSR